MRATPGVHPEIHASYDRLVAYLRGPELQRRLMTSMVGSLPRLRMQDSLPRRTSAEAQ
jgi:hypothetical protein